MRALTVPPVTVIGGEITIDAELLAPKLGLSTEELKAEMHKGLVYSVAEKGINEDQGRMRLTFRYRARSWTVIVEAGGRLMETRPAEAHRNRPSLHRRHRSRVEKAQ
jgi:hypothetical protein